MQHETFDYQYSILLVGNSNVGKTCLLTKYVHGKFIAEFFSTIGIDFKIKSVQIDGKRIKLRIWDTAGQEKFRTITNSYYRNAQSVVVCYAVNDRNSFHSVQNWLNQINQLAGDNTVIVIVGCKCDIHPREVSQEEANRLASENDVSYFEVSAENGTNIDTVFNELLEQMHNNCIEEVSTEQQNGSNSNKEDSTGTVDRNQFLQSAYEVRISGAQSWYNKNKINGRYVPQVTKDGQILLELGRFCYWNIDSPNTVMVYKDKHWVIKRNRKELAKVATSSIQCFPDAASLRNDWYENRGVYFAWMYPQPAIKCKVLNVGADNSSARISVADIFVSPSQRGTINMGMFLQYSKEPEQMGLTIPLFVKCSQIRMAILDLEYRSLKRSYDYVTMAEVRMQRLQIDQTCKALMSTLSLPELSPILVAKESLIPVLEALIEEVVEHYDQLCDAENGNFDAARRCQETLHDLRTSLEKLEAFVPGPDASRLSMMVMEGMVEEANGLLDPESDGQAATVDQDEAITAAEDMKEKIEVSQHQS